MTTDPALLARIATLEAVVARHAKVHDECIAYTERDAGFSRFCAHLRAILHPPAPAPIDPETVIGEPTKGSSGYYIPSSGWAWDARAGKWENRLLVPELCLADALAIRARLVRDRVLPPGGGETK